MFSNEFVAPHFILLLIVIVWKNRNRDCDMESVIKRIDQGCGK